MTLDHNNGDDQLVYWITKIKIMESLQYLLHRKHMSKIIACLLLVIFPFFLHANMAQPYFAGALNASIYGNKNYSVSKEVIDIDIRKDSIENNLISVFKVHYTIQSPGRSNIPLLFLALYRSDTHVIKVNGKTIYNKPLSTQNLKQFPFISRLKTENNEADYTITYAENEGISVRLDDLIYFEAPLIEGENEVYVEYESNFGFQTYGFLKNYTLEYSLYPSQFWKSFGPIHVNLHLNGLAELTKSNLGKAKIENDIAKWTLQTADHDIDIIINHKTNLIGKLLLFLHPFGIACLFLVGMALLHTRLYQRYQNYKNWVAWLGIIFIPALFYTVFLLSFDLIEWVLGYHAKHGYVFLYVITYPVLVLLYGLLFFFWKQKKNNNHIKSQVV